jgi:hypothetical protein
MSPASHQNVAGGRAFLVASAASARNLSGVAEGRDASVFSSSFLLGPVIAVLVVVVIIGVVAVAAGTLFAGRSGLRRAGPAAYFFHTMSLLFLIVGVSTIGISLHAITQLVGPTPGSASSSISGQICSPPIPSSVSPLCNSTNGGQSQGSTGFGDSFAAIKSITDNQNISTAVDAGFFVVAAAVGYALVWPRSRRLRGADPGTDYAMYRLHLGYNYLVAGLAGLTLVVFLPATADSIFRAAAPGVNGTSGHADGVRNLVTFAVLSAIAGVILWYHLAAARWLGGGDFGALRRSVGPPTPTNATGTPGEGRTGWVLTDTPEASGDAPGGPPTTPASDPSEPGEQGPVDP